MQERADQLTNGITPNGAIPLSNLVEFVPNSILLNSGESKQILMKVTIPKDLSEELIGDVYNFSPIYEISAKTGTERIGIFTDGTEIKIRE